MAGEELRSARFSAGLSQETVAAASGLSATQVGRIERGVLASVSVDQLCRLVSVLGLEVWLRFYPAGDPIRDQGQVDLIERFRPNLGSPLWLRTEVLIPIPGDKRAWDGSIEGGRSPVRLEAETRIHDVQALQRRIALKARDSGVAVVILLVSATHANRAALRAADAQFRQAFPVPGRAALRELRAGRVPGGSTIIVV
jgi:transcriptional regulator with XRE-family HTH domain